jgi:hypothetical protein
MAIDGLKESGDKDCEIASHSLSVYINYRIMIEDIKERIRSGRFRLTAHADRERTNDGLTITDIRKVAADAVLIEDYPEDRRGHSCLLCGTDTQNRPVHLVCAIDKKIIMLCV